MFSIFPIHLSKLQLQRFSSALAKKFKRKNPKLRAKQFEKKHWIFRCESLELRQQCKMRYDHVTTRTDIFKYSQKRILNGREEQYTALFSCLPSYWQQQTKNGNVKAGIKSVEIFKWLKTFKSEKWSLNLDLVFQI